MTADLSGIRSLLAGITPGPYIESRYDHGGGRMYVKKDGGGQSLVIDTFGTEGNREFFFAAPSTVARLLGIVEEQQKALDRILEMHKEIESYGGYCTGCHLVGPCGIRAAIAGEGGA